MSLFQKSGEKKDWKAIIIVSIFILLIFAIGYVWYSQEQDIIINYSFTTDKEKLDAIKDNRDVFIQIAAGIFISVGIILTWKRTYEIQRQNDINVDNNKTLLKRIKMDKITAEKNLLELQEKNIQDKETAEKNLTLQQFSKAAELLNNEKIETRLSGIYLFEKIINSNDDYHFPVIEILSAFVREKRNNNKYEVIDYLAKEPEGIELDENTNSKYYIIADEYKIFDDKDHNKIKYCKIKYYYCVPIEKDIQAILTVLGKRDKTMEKYKDEEGETNLIEFINELNNQTLDLIKIYKNNNEDDINRKIEDINIITRKMKSINRIDLRNTNLYKAKLMKLLFENTDCSDAHLVNADCSGAHFENASCIHAHFEKSDCSSAHFENADCHNAHFEKSDCSSAHFENADCHNAHFEYADCWETHFENADCSGAHFEYAGCQVAHFENADCYNAHFENAICSFAHFENADCHNAHFENADCWETHFENAGCQVAHFENAGCIHAHFEYAYCGKANYKNAYCYETHFENTIDLSTEQLTKAETLFGATGLSEEMKMKILELKPDIFKDPDTIVDSEDNNDEKDI